MSRPTAGGRHRRPAAVPAGSPRLLRRAPGGAATRGRILLLGLLVCLAGLVIEYLPVASHNCPIDTAGLRGCGVGRQIGSRLGLALAIVGGLTFVGGTMIPKTIPKTFPKTLPKAPEVPGRASRRRSPDPTAAGSAIGTSAPGGHRRPGSRARTRASSGPVTSGSNPWSTSE